MLVNHYVYNDHEYKIWKPTYICYQMCLHHLIYQIYIVNSAIIDWKSIEAINGISTDGMISDV